MLRRVTIIRAVQFTAAFWLFCVAGFFSYTLLVPSLVVIDRVSAAEYYDDTSINAGLIQDYGVGRNGVQHLTMPIELLEDNNDEVPDGSSRKRNTPDEVLTSSIGNDDEEATVEVAFRDEFELHGGSGLSQMSAISPKLRLRKRLPSQALSVNGPAADYNQGIGDYRVPMKTSSTQPPTTNLALQSHRGGLLIGDARVSLVDLPRTIKTCPEGTNIILFVITAPSNAHRRAVLRGSWMGSDECKEAMMARSIMAVFLSGTPVINGTIDAELMESVKNESLHHGDIIVTDFPDTYRKLTYKVLSGYAWARQFCPSAKYLAKVDDDVFVNVFRVPDFIAKRDVQRRPSISSAIHKQQGSKPWMNIMGPLNPGRQVVHDPKSKWYIPSDVYSADYYPRYAAGFFYVVTSSFAEAALNATQGQKDLFPVDDAYLTGVLAESLGARRTFVEMGARGNWSFGIGSDTLLHWLEADEASPGASMRAAPVAVATTSALAFEAVKNKMKLVALVRQLKRNEFGGNNAVNELEYSSTR